MIIGYDQKRGEPRGKATDPSAGDCIDCHRCVSVCPTGIDIRNGLQMECIGCSACIDACDDIMVKLKRPKGLVRYDSTRGLLGEKRRIFRPRLLAYGLLGLLGLVALGVTAFYRAKPMNADVSRARGPSFYDEGPVLRNHFQLRLFNKRNQAMTFTVALDGAPAGYTITGVGDGLVLEALKETARPLVVIVSKELYKGPRTLTLKIHSEPGNSTIRREVEFLGPNPNFLNP